MFERNQPKERDNRWAIDCLRLDCKHLYFVDDFWDSQGRCTGAIARQTPAIDGTMNFHLVIANWELVIANWELVIQNYFSRPLMTPFFAFSAVRLKNIIHKSNMTAVISLAIK